MFINLGVNFWFSLIGNKNVYHSYSKWVTFFVFQNELPVVKNNIKYEKESQNWFYKFYRIFGLSVGIFNNELLPDGQKRLFSQKVVGLLADHPWDYPSNITTLMLKLLEKFTKNRLPTGFWPLPFNQCPQNLSQKLYQIPIPNTYQGKKKFVWVQHFLKYIRQQTFSASLHIVQRRAPTTIGDSRYVIRDWRPNHRTTYFVRVQKLLNSSWVQKWNSARKHVVCLKRILMINFEEIQNFQIL